MKNITSVFSILSFVGVLVLFGFHFSKPKDQKLVENSNDVAEGTGNYLKIAYINLDSFEANYEYLKQQKAAFDKKQDAMSAELERSARQLQENIEEFQRKAQSGTITQAEGEAMEKKLIQMQQSLQLREQSLTDQLLKDREALNNELRDDLNSFLAEYNKDKGYHYILSYAEIGSPLLYVDNTFDITNDVITGMNERAAQKGTIKKK